MVGRHHQLNGHEFELTLGIGEGQGQMDPRIRMEMQGTQKTQS